MGENICRGFDIGGYKFLECLRKIGQFSILVVVGPPVLNVPSAVNRKLQAAQSRGDFGNGSIPFLVEIPIGSL